MCRAIFVFVCLQTLATAVLIQYKSFDPNVQVGEINLDDIEVSNESITVNEVYTIIILKYNQSDDEVEIIRDMPTLQNIYIHTTAQQTILPTLRNLPELAYISITNNQLLSIKSEAMGNVPVKEITLSANNISVIESKAFGPKVRDVILTCNLLKKFSPRWFQNASALQLLDLSGNQLTYIQKNAFKDFTQLDQIILSYNKITSVGEGAFSHRNSFFGLNLANNLLTELNAKVFNPATIEIASILLQNNKLTFLSEEFLKKTNKSAATIYGNPWQCTCWDIIRQWNTWLHYGQNKDPEGQARCVVPLSFQSECVPAVDHELIEYYEKNNSPGKTAGEFCKEFKENL